MNVQKLKWHSEFNGKIMRLGEKTKKELLKIKEAKLTHDDLLVLEESYLSSIHSREEYIEKKIVVSDSARLSKVVALLEGMPPADLRTIEETINRELLKSSKTSDVLDNEKLPTFRCDLLIQTLKLLTFKKKSKGQGNRNQIETAIRRHLFLEVYAFFIEEKSLEPDEMNSSNWFNKNFMDTLTDDAAIQKLCPHLAIASNSDYILWAKQFYSIRKSIYSEDINFG